MSYEDLLGIVESAKLLDIQHKASLPTACPHDGIPLLAGPDGVLFCKADGWRYNGNRDSAY